MSLAAVGTVGTNTAPSRSPPWPAGCCSPDAAQAIQIRRRRRRRGTKKWSTKTSYAITSLGFAQARAIQLAAIIRGHRKIENELHWVRDMTFGEDRSQTRTATGPASWPASATS
jgi:predicted transposase YbfD/YdcC